MADERLSSVDKLITVGLCWRCGKTANSFSQPMVYLFGSGRENGTVPRSSLPVDVMCGCWSSSTQPLPRVKIYVVHAPSATMELLIGKTESEMTERNAKYTKYLYDIERAKEVALHGKAKHPGMFEYQLYRHEPNEKGAPPYAPLFIFIRALLLLPLIYISVPDDNLAESIDLAGDLELRFADDYKWTCCESYQAPNKGCVIYDADLEQADKRQEPMGRWIGAEQFRVKYNWEVKEFAEKYHQY
tara:strand:+ start:237 stop:968 length:732 start_codon:yes stop_codon:yes gene_type:complete